MSAQRHGNSCPQMCSQCIGVVPKRVEQDADLLLVDGVPVRSVQAPSDGSFYPRRKRK